MRERELTLNCVLEEFYFLRAELEELCDDRN